MNVISQLRKASLALVALAATARAAESPQDTFTHLAQPVQQAPMQLPKRAAALPALALLPAGADMVVAESAAGQDSLLLMRLLGENPPPELERGLSSIGCAALATAEGAEALENALPLLLHASQEVALRKCAASWCKRANPAFAEPIRCAFEKQLSLQKQSALVAYNAFHLAPIYYATTALPGREEDFLALHRQMLEGLLELARQDADIHAVQEGGYVGVSMSQLTAYKRLMKSEPQDADVRNAMAAKQLCLVSRVHGGVGLLVLCERLQDIALPTSPLYSMLCSAKLNGADPYIDHLKATAWTSASFNRTMRTCLQMNRFPLAQAAMLALSNICAVDSSPEHQAVYRSAAQDISQLVWQPPYFEPISTPFAMQVWQQGDGLYMETVSGAQGMEFEPGHLQLVSQASAPNAVFYMESTAFSAPNTPTDADYWNRTVRALLNVGQAYALTLRPEAQESMGHWLHYAKLLQPEIQSLGAVATTLASGLKSPFALLAAQEKAKDGQPTTAWAFFSAVKNRLGLSQGWEALVDTLGHAMGKFGLPAFLVDALPVSAEPLAGGAVEHAIDLPGARFRALPRVAVSDSRFVLGNSAALNAALVAAPDAHMPFCGAVSAIQLPRFAAWAESSACCPKLTAFLRRLAEHVQSVYSVSTIRDGVRTARGVMRCKQ